MVEAAGVAPASWSGSRRRLRA